MERGIKVGTHTTVLLGDVANVGLQSHGCEDEHCPCGGTMLHVSMAQVDGQGCQIILPLRGWALVAAAVQRAIAAAEPTMLAKALDTLDANMQQARTETPVVPTLWADGTGLLFDGPDVVPESVEEAFQRWVGPTDPADRWVSIGSGKFHHVRRVAYEDGVAVEVVTSCGKGADAFAVVTEARPDDLCKSCTRALATT